jgi:PAS domain S-box-containing protein
MTDKTDIDMVHVNEMVAAVMQVSSVRAGLRRVLPMVGHFLKCRYGTANIKKKVDHSIRWATAARWTSEEDAIPAGPSLDMLSRISERLEAKIEEQPEPAVFSIPLEGDLPSADRMLVIPVGPADQVHACICLTGSGFDAISDRVMEKARCVSSLLGLWLKNCRTEKRLEDLIDFIPNPLMMIDTDERVTAWNPAMETMTGVAAAQILGKGNYEHAIPFYSERRPTSSNLILRPDHRYDHRYLELRQEGDTLHALARSEALPGGPMLIASKTRRVYDLDGATAGSVHMIQDVTHERELESSLTRTEKMVESISEFAGVGIVMLGVEKAYSYNDNFLALLELDETALTLDGVLNRIDPDHRATIAKTFGRILDGQQAASFEFVSFLPVKGRREFKGYAQSADYEDAAAIHLVIIDITEAKETERRKQVHQMRMYHSDRLTALGTLSAGIAHELNQPLNTIRVITDGLLYGREQGWPVDENEWFENAAMISRQILRMSHVIKNIRNFARDDKDRHLEEVDPNEAIRNVFSMIGKQLIAHDIRVEQHLEPDLPRLKTRLNHLEQVIMNLVVNARQALDACEKTNKRLWVRTGQRFGHLFLEIGDNATGIPDAHQKELFDPFFTTKAVGQGTGLGLSISQTIVSDFNGEINAYNNADGGATFFITVPVGAS